MIEMQQNQQNWCWATQVRLETIENICFVVLAPGLLHSSELNSLLFLVIQLFLNIVLSSPEANAANLENIRLYLIWFILDFKQTHWFMINISVIYIETFFIM